MKRLVLVLALSLSGCASFSSVHTGSVEVPVAVPCRVPEIPRPAFAIDGVPVDSDVFVSSRALWASIEAWEAYETELQASIAACK